MVLFQLESGPQDGTLLLTWAPVQAQRNCDVLGYVISGKTRKDDPFTKDFRILLRKIEWWGRLGLGWTVARLACLLRGGGLDVFRQGLTLTSCFILSDSKRMGGEYWCFLGLKKVLRGGSFSPKAPPINAPLELEVFLTVFDSKHSTFLVLGLPSFFQTRFSFTNKFENYSRWSRLTWEWKFACQVRQLERKPKFWRQFFKVLAKNQIELSTSNRWFQYKKLVLPES